MFDSVTGVLTTSTTVERWMVLRRGFSTRGLLAHEPGEDSLFNQLRIIPYTSPAQFWLMDGTDVYSGTCAVIEREPAAIQ